VSPDASFEAEDVALFFAIDFRHLSAPAAVVLASSFRPRAWRRLNAPNTRASRQPLKAPEDGQATVGSDRNAYGCCGQALTRFTADPPAGPGRLQVL